MSKLCGSFKNIHTTRCICIILSSFFYHIFHQLELLFDCWFHWYYLADYYWLMEHVEGHPTLYISQYCSWFHSQKMLLYGTLYLIMTNSSAGWIVSHVGEACNDVCMRAADWWGIHWPMRNERVYKGLKFGTIVHSCQSL